MLIPLTILLTALSSYILSGERNCRLPRNGQGKHDGKAVNTAA